MTEATLFDAPWLHARTTDPATSHDAAQVAVGNSPLRARVLHAHTLHRLGLTDDELCQLLPEDHPGSVAKRRKDLHRAGLIRPTDETRPTRRRVQAVVWVIA